VRSLRNGHHVSYKEQVSKDQSPDEGGGDVGESFLATHANLVTGDCQYTALSIALICLPEATYP
jgi:hypothetical protein